MAAEDPKDVVRRGYDAVSVRYDEEYGGEAKYQPWLSELRERIRAGGAVLDLGCGSGLPVARDLTAAGYRVTGVDISPVQIRRARELVPEARFIRGDVAAVGFSPASFDAVVSFFALIHLPLVDQPRCAGQGRDLAAARRIVRGHDWLLGMDGHRGGLAGRRRSDVVEPRRRGHVPVLDQGGRPPDRPRGVRARR